MSNTPTPSFARLYNHLIKIILFFFSLLLSHACVCSQVKHKKHQKNSKKVKYGYRDSRRRADARRRRRPPPLKRYAGDVLAPVSNWNQNTYRHDQYELITQLSVFQRSKPKFLPWISIYFDCMMVEKEHVVCIFSQRKNELSSAVTLLISPACLSELSPEPSGAPDGNRFLYQQRQHDHTHCNWLWLWDGLHGAAHCRLACL